MGTLVSTNQISIVDLNDVKISASAPASPVLNQLWFDTSITPPALKMWNGTSWISANISPAEYTAMIASVAKTDAALDTNGYIIKTIKGINLPSTNNVEAGLNMTKDYIGFNDGTGATTGPASWKAYIDKTGKFKFGDGINGPGLAWDPTAGTSGTLAIRGTLKASDIESGGSLSGVHISGGDITIGTDNSVFKADNNGIYLGNATFASAPFSVTPLGLVKASNINITGGTVSIGNNFSVSNTGVVTCAGANISGTLTIGAGSTGYSNLAGIPTSLSAINSTEGTKLGGIASGADVSKDNVFVPYLSWEFSGTTDSWTGGNATLATGTDYITITATTGDPIFYSPALSIDGSLYDKIRVRVRRVAGSGWDGACYYMTSGHGWTSPYYVRLNQPTTLVSNGVWTILEFDMATLTDWTSNVITQFRLDFGGSVSDIFDVDYVAIGKRGVSPLWSGVTGSGKPSDNATSDLAPLITTGGCTAQGNIITKSTGIGSWDSSAYSKEGYVGGVFVSWVHQGGTYIIGLNTDPTTSSSWETIDFSMMASTGSLPYSSESSSLSPISPGSPSAATNVAIGDVYAITYDGTNVRYFQNGNLIKTSPYSNATAKFYLDSSFQVVSSKATNVRFGPLTSNNWQNIGGTGKPADGATVGADWLSNLNNIPLRFKDTPTVDGLYATATSLGYYKSGSPGSWKTYMANNGDFFLAGQTGNNSLTWNSAAGTLQIAGNITAYQGYIGNGSSGWTIGNTSIYNGRSALGTGAGIYIGTDGIALGATAATPEFKVTSAGALTATNANITGTINATGGYIGSSVSKWYIGDGKIYNGRTGLTTGAAGVYIGSDGIALGNTVATPEFKVTSTGALTATNATISGSINTGLSLTVGSTITIDANASTPNIRIGKSSFTDNSNNGIWMGAWASGAHPMFVVGSQNNYIQYNDITPQLLIKTGGLTIDSGVTNDGLNGYIGIGKQTFSDTNAGVWIGNNAGTPSLKLYKDSNNYLSYDTTNGLEIRGKLNANDISSGTFRAKSIQTEGGITLNLEPAGTTNYTLTLDNTSDFPASGTAYIVATYGPKYSFTYTGKTSAALTGCDLSSMSNIPSGTSVTVNRQGVTINPVQGYIRTDYSTAGVYVEMGYNTNGYMFNVSSDNIAANFVGTNTSLQVRATTGYGIMASSGRLNPSWQDGKSPLRLQPAISSAAPTHSAYMGSLWVTSAGVLYINTTAGGIEGTTWQKVGAQ